MDKKLNETEGAVNEVRVASIKKILSKLQGTIDYVLKIMHLFKRMKR